MRRPCGHIRQRSPGSFEIRYRADARTVTTTIKGTRSDAEKELRRRLRAVDLSEHVDPTRMTVREWLVQWLKTIRQEVSPKTHERYAEIVNNSLIPALGAVPITKLTPTHIQAAHNAWATGGRRDGKAGGLSPLTRRYLHILLKSALTRAVEQQVLARNPADAFKRRLPKIERKEMMTLTADQQARLLEALSNSRVYWPVLLALSTGMRRGEILALRWKNVELERGVVRVVQSLEQTAKAVRFKDTKTRRSRAITLPAFAVEELCRLRRQQAEELLQLGIRQTGETLVCPRADGEPHQPRSLTQGFSRLVGRMKDIPRIRFHDLRHSHATTLLADGVHPKVAQERLGHSTITTTMDLYSHVTDTMQADAAARLDAAFRVAKARPKGQT
jgi:integrase